MKFLINKNQTLSGENMRISADSNLLGKNSKCDERIQKYASKYFATLKKRSKYCFATFIETQQLSQQFQ